jgi:hypothetical protein
MRSGTRSERASTWNGKQKKRRQQGRTKRRRREGSEEALEGSVQVVPVSRFPFPAVQSAAEQHIFTVYFYFGINFGS